MRALVRPWTRLFVAVGLGSLIAGHGLAAAVLASLFAFIVGYGDGYDDALRDDEEPGE